MAEVNVLWIEEKSIDHIPRYNQEQLTSQYVVLSWENVDEIVMKRDRVEEEIKYKMKLNSDEVCRNEKGTEEIEKGF